MGDPRGFLKYQRQDLQKQAVGDRIQHSQEFVKPFSPEVAVQQGSRCMECGVPFCHSGCPLGNKIPDWNHFVSQGQWQAALESLESTNNFPEFTGRVCPAPCETSCVLGINEDPVAIESLEMAISDRGFTEGWISPQPPNMRLNLRVAVVGSGPAGLAAAQQLNRKGYHVDVFERADRVGGLLMYGIPEFKLEKAKVLRRVDQLRAEGVNFFTNFEVGVTESTEELMKRYQALLLSCGARQPRDIAIPGRDLKGIFFADSILTNHTRSIFGDCQSLAEISAHGKDVIVIGGGDTGSDCVGTSRRQGARSIKQFEILSKPPTLGKHPRAWQRPNSTRWPDYTHLLRTSSSQEEGCKRFWTLRTKEFHGDSKGNLQSLVTETLAWSTHKSGSSNFKVVANSQKKWPCQMALVAVGFLGPETSGPIQQLGIGRNELGLVRTDSDYMTDVPGIFSAGDMRRGQSLVVWAIQEGRAAAESIHKYLQMSNKISARI